MAKSSLLVILATVSACNGHLDDKKATPDQQVVLRENYQFDAGIVLSGTRGYYCIPIESIGLKPQDAIVSLRASCECVSPRVLEVAKSKSSTFKAIFLEYVDDLAQNGEAGGEADTPLNLSVIVQLELADGTKKEFTLNLFHSHTIDVLK